MKLHPALHRGRTLLGVSPGSWLSAAASLAAGGARRQTHAPELLLVEQRPRADTALVFEAIGARDELPASAGFTLPLINVGAMTARHVTARWSFPLAPFAAEVNALARRSGAALRFAWGADEYLELYVGDALISLSNWPVDRRCALGEVLPLAKRPDDVPLAVPLAIRDLWLAYLHCALRENFATAHPADLPVAGLTLSYTAESAPTGDGGAPRVCEFVVSLVPASLKPGAFEGRLRADAQGAA